ncbi:ABC transporter permease subunit [Auraticoccus monumenti]|uniref:ABC-2 family transporter protein n=1 Tax=Auraticoccus monumenti TaxID=675864 RepID=A0A1G6W6I4_9ACTN|nr:ABC transporter permease subunit [Auraticoccus monumenti]SDD61550.1 ABC-2 family transporter protein [Auraticoccus monumenti]
MRLLLAELNRIRLRRLTWVVTVVLLLALAGLTLIGAFSMRPVSAAESAEGRAFYEESLRYWEQDRERGITDCVEYQGLSEEECQQQYESYQPSLDQYLRTPTPFADAATLVLSLSTYLLGLGGLLIAASVIGAELSSGAIGNWLTFIPRRVPVYLAKLGAVVVALLLGAAVLQTLLVLAHVVLATTHGAVWGDVGGVWWMAARSLLVVLALSVVGFTVACLGRHTIVAVGAFLGYGFLAIVHGVLQGFPWASRLMPWVPHNNLEAVVQRGYSYQVVTEDVTADGIMPTVALETISLTQGLLYWAVVLAVLVTVSLLVFRRRDVG